MNFSFYNSGIYLEPFFEKLDVNLFTDDQYLYEIEYDYELWSRYYKEELGYRDDDDDEDEMDREFWAVLSFRGTYFKPIIFNKEIALRCGLIPFEYKDVGLLASDSGGMELSYKLDAYQLLTDDTIDPKSRIFTCSFAREYFENIVGEEITQEILQNWEKLNGKNLRV